MRMIAEVCNVVIVRLVLDVTTMQQHELSWIHLLPMLSWIVQILWWHCIQLVKTESGGHNLT